MSGNKHDKNLQQKKFEYKKQNKENKFSSENKKKLCALVRAHECIWDPQNPKHHKNFTLISAWKKIAATMNSSVDICKSTFKSLKNSSRYHIRKKSCKIHSDSVGAGDSDSDEWEFATDLSFLPLTIPNDEHRTSLASTNVSKNEEMLPHLISTNEISNPLELNSISEDSISPSVYSYMPNARKKRKASSTVIEGTSLTTTMDEFVEYQKPKLVLPEYRMKHTIMLMNLDRMLQKLPDDIVEVLNHQFTSRTLEEIQKLNKDKYKTNVQSSVYCVDIDNLKSEN